MAKYSQEQMVWGKRRMNLISQFIVCWKEQMIAFIHSSAMIVNEIFLLDYSWEKRGQTQRRELTQKSSCKYLGLAHYWSLGTSGAVVQTKPYLHNVTVIAYMIYNLLFLLKVALEGATEKVKSVIKKNK